MSAALTWVNMPPGGIAWPSWLFPQQATVPSALTPQLWNAPALTSVYLPAGHLGERARRRRRLTGLVVAPTGDRPVGFEPAGAVTPRAHRCERARWWGRLSVFVVPPARHGPVSPKSAGVRVSRADFCHGARRE